MDVCYCPVTLPYSETGGTGLDSVEVSRRVEAYRSRRTVKLKEVTRHDEEVRGCPRLNPGGGTREARVLRGRVSDEEYLR